MKPEQAELDLEPPGEPCPACRRVHRSVFDDEECADESAAREDAEERERDL